MNKRRIAGPILSLLAVLARAPYAEAHDIVDMDLTTLMNMDVTVTSASRRAQASSDAAAAVFVITHEDIRRSGATNIPELLRFVPGLQVARATSNRWAITARGFNSRFGNKLLVLVDGRDVYSQEFGGVFWEYLQIPLDEITRIEVIRGAGGALWGANAVNGVINIITHSAAESAGLKVSAGAGNDDEESASIHFGDAIGANQAYRTYFEHIQRASYDDDARPWRHSQGGWRFDGRTDESSTYTVQGDISKDDLGDLTSFGLARAPIENNAANINFNWEGAAFANGRFAVQSSHSWREAKKLNQTAEREQVFDLNAQYNAARMGRHLVTFGGGWRWMTDNFVGPPGLLTFTPQKSTRDQENLYAQDEIFLFSDRVRLTLGGKLEHYDFSGSSLQPTARALWHVDEEHTVWTAFSRALRTPSRFERTAAYFLASVPGATPVDIYLLGNPRLRREKLTSRELGWRWRPSKHWSADLALYDNEYTELTQMVPLPPQSDPGPPPRVIINQLIVNRGEARTRGADLAIDWLALPTVRVQAIGSWLKMRAPRVSFISIALEGADPEQSYSLRVRKDLPFNSQLDVTYRYVGELPAVAVSAYDTVGLRLGWRAAEKWDLSFTADNLFNKVHREFTDEEEYVGSDDRIGRSVFFRVRWHSIAE